MTTTADDNVLPHIRVVKEGTTLKISVGKRQLPAQEPLQGRDHAAALIGLDISGDIKRHTQRISIRKRAQGQGIGLERARGEYRARNGGVRS